MDKLETRIERTYSFRIINALQAAPGLGFGCGPGYLSELPPENPLAAWGLHRNYHLESRGTEDDSRFCNSHIGMVYLLEVNPSQPRDFTPRSETVFAAVAFARDYFSKHRGETEFKIIETESKMLRFV